MADSVDGEVDYKASYFKCLEERDIARRDYEVMYKLCRGAEEEVLRLKSRVQYIEPVYYRALDVAEWDWASILQGCETSDGFEELSALCRSLEGHP